MTPLVAVMLDRMRRKGATTSTPVIPPKTATNDTPIGPGADVNARDWQRVPKGTAPSEEFSTMPWRRDFYNPYPVPFSPLLELLMRRKPTGNIAPAPWEIAI